jgi:hypothetical protein
MNLDRISERATYLMWRKEHLWNFGILQSVQRAFAALLAAQLAQTISFVKLNRYFKNTSTQKYAQT